MTQLRNDNVGQILHVRFDGRSEELSLAALALDRYATDGQIKQAVAAHFDRPAGSFDAYVVVRHSDAIVLRPEAVYG